MEWSWRWGLQRVVLSEGCSGAPGCLRFWTTAEAEGFIQQSLDYPEARGAWRGACGLGVLPLTLPDTALAEALAEQLLKGRLCVRLVSEAAMFPLPVGTAEAEPAPPPRTAAPPPPPPPEPPPEPSEMAGVDESVQAEMLREAAATGVPFCIPCMLKRLGLAA